MVKKLDSIKIYEIMKSGNTETLREEHHENFTSDIDVCEYGKCLHTNKKGNGNFLTYSSRVIQQRKKKKDIACNRLILSM